MNYVLIDKKQLDAKGLFPYAEQLPDGRVILPLNALKSMAGLTGLDIVDSETIKVLQEIVPPPVSLEEPEDIGEVATENQPTTGKEVING